MTNSNRLRELLAAWELERLFVEELGWDRHEQRLDVEVDARRYELRALAQKRGMVAFSAASPDGDLPDHAVRRRIDREATRTVHEHIIVYSDVARKSQVWQWVRREPGRPVASREQWYRAGSSGEALVQRLSGLAFTFEEESSVSIVDVARRTRSTFDVEQLTRQFYGRFQAEHEAFMAFISGLGDAGHLQWYASVMLNRLMFVYFIQKKGFLDGDRDYLRNRLVKTQRLAGRDQFLTFYRCFLRRLFHEALGTDASSRPKDLDALVGHVPYLNGGLFDVHELERDYPDIDIPDTAFERLFDFFDAYQWHLDDRPLRADNEINPDVLGYIFEKYINQKQMGAYYTKEDITEYIARNVVVAEFMRRAEMNRETISSLVSNDPDAYIFPAVRLGGDSAPELVARGAKDVVERRDWNTPADPAVSGENESWREWAGRQEWYRAINARAAAGRLRTPEDLVTHNVDLRQVAQDAIETCDRPEQLLRYYETLSTLSILDPTCGSGAFLFAALNVLEPLYDACLDRMAAFLETGAELDSSLADQLRAILQRVADHHNHRYFVLKSIILNNLYGVDIMEEAVEICKLRLFLKLVAEMQELRDLEPLPDIDFNIRAGNALVGYASRDEVDQSLAQQIDFEGVGARIEASAANAGRLFNDFRTAQTGVDVPSGQIRSAKRELRDGLDILRVELDAQLAATYGVDRAGDDGVPAEWKRSHKPFHWFAEFYDVIASGGFDCVIGNPPYVEYRDVQRTYTLPDRLYKTESCKNLFAFAYERSLSLVRAGAWVGLIIPVASLCTDRYRPLQSLWLAGGLTVASSFNDRPSRLFEGIEHARLAIVLHRGPTGAGDRRVFTTNYLKWTAAERATLFERLMFVDSTQEVSGLGIPKIGRAVEAGVLSNVQAQPRQLAHFVRKTGTARIYYTRKLSHFVQILDFVPEIIDQNGERREPSELKELRFDDHLTALAYLAFLNSSLFYWYLAVFSDCRNLNRRDVDAAPFDIGLAKPASVQRLAELATELMADFRKNSEMRAMSYAGVGVLSIQCIFPRKSKRLIDEIDHVLAEHYDLTSAELDFIHNFDVKYRVGGLSDDEESRDVSAEAASAAA